MIFGKHINSYYRKYWYLFLAVLICDTIVDLVQLLIPMVIGNLVNVFSLKEGEYSTVIDKNPLRVFYGFSNKFTLVASEDVAWYQTDMFVVIMAFMIIAILVFLGRMGWRIFSSQIGANIERDLRREMFVSIQRMSLAYYSEKKVGGLLSFFTNDLSTIKMCFTDGLIFTTDLVVLGTCSLVLMFRISWPIALFTCIPLLLFVVLGKVIGDMESKRYKISSDAFELMSDFAEENLQGFQVIKAFRKEKDRAFRFRKYVDDTGRTSVSYLKFSSLIDFSITTYISITYGVLYFLSGYAILKNGNTWLSGNMKTVGDLTKFAGYYECVIWPMIAAGMLIDYASRGKGARERIATILDSKPDINDEKIKQGQAISGNVTFKNLSFRYPGSEIYALENLDFEIKPGTTVGIIGRTGSGKSTLVSLLPKLYNIDRGMLLFDGVDINEINKKDLRESIGFVQQESFLFSGTIKENVAFSENKIGTVDMEKVKECCAFADIDEDIRSFPDGYDTKVGEKGATLSGGQRQRVSIARALYKNPKILILDDSLSAVDADTEKNIVEHLKNSKKTTTIIIGHRISAIENADLILVMDKGKIIGKGKHEELYKSCSLYHDLVELQRLEKEVLC